MPLSPSVLARLYHQHKTIDELIAPLTEVQIREHVSPGKWSAFENIVHLGAYQPAFLQRIQVILSENEPLFERYVADNDPAFHACLEKSLTELLKKISSDREKIITMLTPLTEEQLNRKGRHRAYGLMSLGMWCDFFLLHEGHHLWTIFQLTAVAGATTHK